MNEGGGSCVCERAHYHTYARVDARSESGREGNAPSSLRPHPSLPIERDETRTTSAGHSTYGHPKDHLPGLDGRSRDVAEKRTPYCIRSPIRAVQARTPLLSLTVLTTREITTTATLHRTGNDIGNFHRRGRFPLL